MFLKYILKLVIILISINTLNAQCVDTTLINPQGICTQIYDPVCGCNGKTYENVCTAEITDGITSTMAGICPITQTYSNCAAEDIQIGIIPNPSNSYSWNPANNLTCTDCANPIANPIDTIIYELTTTNTSGVSTYTYFEIMVESCPSQTDVICLGENVQIGTTADTLSTFLWSPTTNLTCTDCANPVASPDSSIIYQLIATDQSGVATYTYFEIIVEPCPPVSYTICVGDSTQIGVTADSLSTYLWDPATDLTCIDCADPIANPTATTTYQLTTTDPSGISTNTFHEITVDPCPTQIDTLICLGDSVQIGAVADSLNTYSWSPANNLTCIDCANPIADPAVTTNYELTTTDTSGISTFTYYEVVVEQCLSVCEINNGFSYQISNIVKTGDKPASQIDFVVDFTQDFQSDEACIWSWDFGNGTTSSERNPLSITFSTIKDSIPVVEAYQVCMSVFDCGQQLLETCCQPIGPYVPCEDGSLTNAVQNCDTAIDPICGCDNKSYPNICNAINTNGIHNWTNGPCTIDNTYQICAGQTVRIGLSNFLSGVQYSWYPTNSISCNSACYQTTASATQNTLYQLTLTNNNTGEKTYKYYQVDVLDKQYCCTSDNLTWLDNLLDDSYCNSKYSEVKQIEIDGSDHIYFKKDTSNFSDATSLLTNCNGTIVCSEDSTGFCLDTLNYTVVENIWSKTAFCDACNVADVNEISWLYSSYGNGDYEVGKYNYNNDIAFYIEKCNTSPADTINRMLVNCNNELLCSWNRFNIVVDNANCNNFFSQGVLVEQVINCGCIDPGLIDPTKNCSPFMAQICGCDGKTYRNFCEGKKFGGITSWTQGACNNNTACVDTLKVLNGFLESQTLKALDLLQVGVPVIGNNKLKLQGEETIELTNGFECPKNSTFEILNKTCF